MPDRLTSSVASLLASAEEAATTPEAQDRLADARRRLGEPLRLAIAGKVKAGKSTLLNALLGEELAMTDASECTRIVTWYRSGDHPQVILHPRSGSPVPRPFNRDVGAIDVDLGEESAESTDHLEIRWPTGQLRELTLIDTPGIASISAQVSVRTYEALAQDDDKPPVADAVLYLLRHTHASDVRFLEAFHDDELAHGTSINTVGILARADEIGSARLDALEVAARVANRYQHEPRLRRLCPFVLPVAGLLGYAGASLREAEYRALVMVARADRKETEELLLTADRFARWPGPVTEIERQHLLERLGLFGVRLAIELIRTGITPSASSLGAELTRRSGLQQLRAALLNQFSDRSNVLKSRSALATFRAVASAGGCRDAGELLARAEEIVAAAHEFQEVRLLNELRAGSLGLPEERAEELDRLLGGAGHGAHQRLGVPDDTEDTDIRAAALEALARWRRIAEHPLSTRPGKMAARVATRTLEGLLAS